MFYPDDRSSRAKGSGLTHFSPVSHFYLTFSGGIEM